MATKRTPTPATPEPLTVDPEDVRDALGLHGAVLAHRAGTTALLVLVPLTPLAAAYAVVADAEQLRGYLAEYGTPTAAAEQLTAELRAELVTA